MFVLQEVDGLLEFDGCVHFTWLPAKTRVHLSVGEPNTFLELRLGYPQADSQKHLIVRGAGVRGGEFVQTFRHGWNSYFIPLVGRQEIEIEIDKPLIVPDDHRYLGAMLSYAAVTDDQERVAEIQSVNRVIDEWVGRHQQSASIAEWVRELYDSILSSEDEFYSLRAPAVPETSDLLDPVKQWSVHFKREKWLLDRVRHGVVVELGSCRGGLAALKQHGSNLIGVDLSLQNCKTSLARGYDACLQASGVKLPLADASADYVISADVLGHVPVAMKQELIREMHRVLKPGGDCLHLIETDNFDPHQLPPADFARMVVVDGHVGIVGREVTERQFSEVFEIQDSFLVGHAWMSLEYALRAHDLDGLNLPGPMFAAMSNASPSERTMHDVGVGRTFWSAFDQRHDTTVTCGTLFLHARKPQ